MIKIKIYYFAKIHELTKINEEQISIENGCTLNKLINYLVQEKYKNLNKVIKDCSIAINQDYVDLHKTNYFVLNDGDEVAIIPPVSGG